MAPASLGVNDEVDFFREQVGDVANNVAAEKIDQSMAFGCAENQPGCAERSGNVHNRLGGGRTHGISEERLMIAAPSLRFVEDPAGFLVFGPLALRILLGHVGLLANEK